MVDDAVTGLLLQVASQDDDIIGDILVVVMGFGALELRRWRTCPSGQRRG